MSESITLYSFADIDRSGKVRWLAEELGLEVVEERVAFGANRQPPYTDLNPLGRVPTVRFRDEVLTESTAILHRLAESVEQPALYVDRGDPARADFVWWMATFGETLEARLVECSISKGGLVGPEYFELNQGSCRATLKMVAQRLPSEGWLCGERFTLADIVAGYSLRLAVGTGLIERGEVEPYLSRLVERPAARRARVFDSLTA
jgi:glutathione S-transferase